MNILTLNLNKEYFNEIKSGIKKEEYREVKDYWNKRLNKKYDYIVIKCGYPNAADISKELWFEWNGFIKKKIIHKHFNNKEIEVYAINLDKVIENPKISKIKECIKQDLRHFPNIENWFDSIIDDEEHIIKVFKNFYYILKRNKNKICRVEKFNNDVSLSDILKEIKKDINKPISVIVPIFKMEVVEAFKKNGFNIKRHLLNKYKEGENCYLMENNNEK